MRFHNAIRGQTVEVKQEKRRGIVKDLRPSDEHVLVQFDETGSSSWNPAKDLKLIANTAAELASGADKKFQKKLLKQINKTTKAYRQASVQKTKKRFNS